MESLAAEAQRSPLHDMPSAAAGFQQQIGAELARR